MLDCRVQEIPPKKSSFTPKAAGLLMLTFLNELPTKPWHDVSQIHTLHPFCFSSASIFRDHQNYLKKIAQLSVQHQDVLLNQPLKKKETVPRQGHHDSHAGIDTDHQTSICPVESHGLRAPDFLRKKNNWKIQETLLSTVFFLHFSVFSWPISSTIFYLYLCT